MSFDNIVQRLEGVRPYKSHLPTIENSVRAQCPHCGGSATKLNVSLFANGKVVIKCFGGCTFPQVVDALGLDASEYFPATKSHFNHSKNHNNKIKGWEWWSMVSALEHAYTALLNQHIELTAHLPIDAPARLIMATAAGAVKELAEMFKNGRKEGQA